MLEADWGRVLREAADRSVAFLEGLPGRSVGPVTDHPALRQALGGPVPEGPTDPAVVVAELADAAEPGITAMQSGRYFGFVIGGGVPAAVGADWLTVAWDQNAGLFAAAPAASVVEEVATDWLVDLLGLPAGVTSAFVTGSQLAHVVCLCAARHHVLTRVGWNVEDDGLFDAPPVRVIVGEERHSTVDRALRYIGFGAKRVEIVPADAQGRMRADALADTLAAGSGPAIVNVQLGNVNTGAFDPVGAISEAAHEHDAWVHVDGAFGLWAAASPRLQRLTEGAELADSWATDAHKWLNVPYDSGLAFTRHREAHAGAFSARAAYLIQGTGTARDELDWNPEFSRRARGFAVWAAIRQLGRSGIAELVDRCCANARRFADHLGELDGVEILNDVVLNQVLVRFDADDDRTADVVRRVQADGTCWMSGTSWQGRGAMRISVSNWSTTEDDVDLSVEAIARCLDAARDRS